MTCTTYGFLIIIFPARELVNGTRSLYILSQSSRIPLHSTQPLGLFGQRKDVLMIAVFVWLSFVRLGSKRSGQQILMVASKSNIAVAPKSEYRNIRYTYSTGSTFDKGIIASNYTKVFVYAKCRNDHPNLNILSFFPLGFSPHPCCGGSFSASRISPSYHRLGDCS